MLLEPFLVALFREVRVAGTGLLDLEPPVDDALGAIHSDDPHRSLIDGVPRGLFRPDRKLSAFALNRKDPPVIASSAEVIHSLGVKGRVNCASRNGKRNAVFVHPLPI